VVWEERDRADSRRRRTGACAPGPASLVLRSPPATPAIGSTWSGPYSDYTLELKVTSWDSVTFEGEMSYPPTGTVTRVNGRIEGDVATLADAERRRRAPALDAGRDGIAITFTETDYLHQGAKTVDVRGEYRAVISAAELHGAWFAGERRVEHFVLRLASA
jgi:hypothetical protein